MVVVGPAVVACVKWSVAATTGVRANPGFEELQSLDPSYKARIGARLREQLAPTYAAMEKDMGCSGRVISCC